MALQKAYATDTGVEFPEAYHRVIEIGDLNYANDSLEFKVAIYKDNSFRILEKPFIISTFTVNEFYFNQYFSSEILQQENVEIRGQIYLWLKEAVSEYLDAIDV